MKLAPILDDDEDQGCGKGLLSFASSDKAVEFKVSRKEIFYRPRSDPCVHNDVGMHANSCFNFWILYKLYIS